MPDATPTPAPKATLKDRIERDQLAEPGSRMSRLAGLISSTKEKTGR
jgi:hypothetical protein